MNGIEKLIEKHQEKAEEGSFESLMCAFALEMLEWKKSKWKFTLIILGIAVVPIILIVLDKVL